MYSDTSRLSIVVFWRVGSSMKPYILKTEK